MSLLGNIIWLIFGGFLGGVGYILGGLSTCLTIIGIPFGLEAIKVGFATFTPFGREIKKSPAADTTLVQIL
ncbi:MAG TPA: YccF domain-containing protein, partial [Candidatus Obscuribacterales bacterium]